MNRLKAWIEKKRRLIVFIFFAVLLGLGLSIFRDYGISLDEGTSRVNGVMAIQYMTHKDPRLLSTHCRNYGTAYEVVLTFLERGFKLSADTQGIFFMRHLVNFLLFYLGLTFFYKLLVTIFGNWKVALLGVSFLVLSPRIFAEAFYNPKDMPFFSVFIISIYTLIRYLDNKVSLKAAFFHAITCAILIDIRIAGIIAVVFTVIFWSADLSSGRSAKAQYGKAVITFLLYLVFLVAFTVLFWPVLWTKPLYHFGEVFLTMAHFPLRLGLLYLGRQIESTKLPWHYIPVWIAISTPLVYTFCFLAGCCVLFGRIYRDPVKFFLAERNILIAASWFFAPLITVIVMRSVLYDSWRHMFFVYPAFLILALCGLVYIFKFLRTRFNWPGKLIIRTLFLGLIALDLATVITFMVKYHPYQNLYFNRLAGRDMKEIKERFELDYWGLATRKALEYIVKNDPASAITVYSVSGDINRSILEKIDQKRLFFVLDPKEAKYFISNYRWHKDEYPCQDEFYSIKIEGTRIMIVCKSFVP